MKEKVELEIEVVSVEDAEALIEYTKKVGKETDFLSFGEEGLELTIQQEELYIQSVLESDNQMMLLAKLGQEIIAVASIGGNSKEKFHLNKKTERKLIYEKINYIINIIDNSFIRFR